LIADKACDGTLSATVDRPACSGQHARIIVNVFNGMRKVLTAVPTLQSCEGGDAMPDEDAVRFSDIRFKDPDDTELREWLEKDPDLLADIAEAQEMIRERRREQMWESVAPLEPEVHAAHAG
jgi:hypothetical protein